MLTWHEPLTLIFTFVAILVAITGVVWSGILTRQSNNETKLSNVLMKKNLFLLHRPWLVITNPEIIFIQGITEKWNKKSYDSLTLDKWNANQPLQQIEWKYTIYNNGNVPIKNICVHNIEQWDKEITPQMLEESAQRITSSTLLPQGSTQYSIVMKLSNVKNYETRNYWVGVLFTYDYDNYDEKTSSHHVGRIWSFREDSWRGKDSWTD